MCQNAFSPCLQEIRMHRSKRDASVQRVHKDSSETGSWQPARISNFNLIHGLEKISF